MRIRETTLVFYLVPLLRKWRKLFPSPKILVVSETPLPTALLEKRLKARPCQRIAPQEVFTLPQQEGFDLILFSHPTITLAEVVSLAQTLKPHGALVGLVKRATSITEISPEALDKMGLHAYFLVGLHPAGAVAWWPLRAEGLLLWLGQCVDNLLMFFPGRYEVALRYGHYQLFRVFKRYDQTLLC